MKDDTLFEESLLLLIPVKHHEATLKVIAESKKLLMRYFIGVLLELLGVMSIISLGLWIFGVENALLIGFFGGIMNIIPYLGPIIGSAIGITLGVTATLAFGDFSDLLPVLAKLSGVFLAVNFIDNNILVPLIYSKSVKAHPLEIFFVIIMGGSLAGLLGMLLAIPVYTVLRVIAKEFFQQFRVVQKLTSTID
jgi:predicted PurR-regulated permease PerM